MQLQLPTLLESVTTAACIVAAIIVTAMVAISRLSKSRKLDAIPTVGESSWFETLWFGPKFRTNADDVIREGYEKYKSVPFKVADRYRWVVVVSGHQHVEELRKAPDDSLSFILAMNEELKLEYTMGPEQLANQYHSDIIHTRLTRNLNTIYGEIKDEIFMAFDELLGLRGNEWKSVPALSIIQKVTCRAANRQFVGLPLCRDPDWIDLGVRYLSVVVGGAKFLRPFPGFLVPIVARFMTSTRIITERAMKHLAPIIEERLKLMEEHGNDWDGKPNDLLSWLLEEAPEGPERTVKFWTNRVLATNFAATNTTANSFWQAFLFLAENPQYIKSLREEVEAIVEEEGWSKASLEKMHKIDSFLKESQRLVGTVSLTLMRFVLKDFTFSDGTFIPKGAMLVVPSRFLHLDDEHYENARAFNPFRFSDMRNGTREDVGKCHFVSTSPVFLSFGHGKHTCPGRFFAATMLKTMLARIVLLYDVKLEGGQTRNTEARDGGRILPDPSTKVAIRRRAH